jgi:hypothetical protein
VGVALVAPCWLLGVPLPASGGAPVSGVVLEPAGGGSVLCGGLCVVGGALGPGRACVLRALPLVRGAAAVFRVLRGAAAVWTALGLARAWGSVCAPCCAFASLWSALWACGGGFFLGLAAGAVRWLGVARVRAEAPGSVPGAPPLRSSLLAVAPRLPSAAAPVVGLGWAVLACSGRASGVLSSGRCAGGALLSRSRRCLFRGVRAAGVPSDSRLARAVLWAWRGVCGACGVQAPCRWASWCRLRCFFAFLSPSPSPSSSSSLSLSAACGLRPAVPCNNPPPPERPRAVGLALC